MMLKKWIMLVCVAFSFFNLANAEETSGVTISPMIGMTLGDDIDTDLHYSIGVGYQFDSPWAIEAVYSELSTNNETSGAKLDFTRWHIDGLYHTYTTSDVRPYVSFGIGNADYDFGAAGSKDSTLYNIGAGIKWAFAENTSFRGELKLFDSKGVDEVNAAVSVGITHVFGHAKPVAMAAPQQVVLDSDHDGVPDDSDRCPTTPANVAVDSKGCALDDDRDGVANYLDKCPDTTNRRARIDEDGCYEVLLDKVSVDLNVQFDTDSAEAKPEHLKEVERVFKFMEEYPETKVTIEGHTDNAGNADYNKNLSQRRADTIANILINDYHIDPSRVSAVGYGEEKPIASNETKSGRQKNRRVVGVVEANVEKIIKK